MNISVRDAWRVARDLPEPVSQWFRMSVATILIDVELMDADQMKTVGDMATFVAGHSQPA